MQKYGLEIVVFICGAAVMILELLGSRILAPYLGTSLLVWTSLIGIILGSLSVGYWIGGRISDQKPDLKIFSTIIFSSGMWMGLIPLMNDIVLIIMKKFVSNIQTGAVIACLILFAVPGILLGMVSPYAVRLKIKTLENSGRTVGNLYAISTVGSIVGTFLTGFFLVPFLKVTTTLFILSSILILISILIFRSWRPKFKTALIVLSLLGAFGSDSIGHMIPMKGFVDINTQYNRVWILDTGQPIRTRKLYINNILNSEMYLDREDLVFPYTKFYHTIQYFNPSFKKTLMIGGGAYSYAKDYLAKYPSAEIDVVEIDPQLTYLAKKYFNLKDNPRLNIYHEDGRMFLNRMTKKYDGIFIDAFNAPYTIPFHLTTKEIIQKMYDSLGDNGVVIINIISGIEGKKGLFLRSEYFTYKAIFPQVYLFPIRDPLDPFIVQNVMLVALKSDLRPSFVSHNTAFKEWFQNLWRKPIKHDVPILTDDYAPVEQFVLKAIPKNYKGPQNPIVGRIKALMLRLFSFQKT